MLRIHEARTSFMYCNVKKSNQIHLLRQASEDCRYIFRRLGKIVPSSLRMVALDTLSRFLLVKQMFQWNRKI